MSKLDRDAQGGHRKHAAPLHPRSGRSRRRLNPGTGLSGKPPLILALDAAGSSCAVAVARGNEIVALRHEPMLHGQAEALLPMIELAVREAGVAVAALDLVAAATGPGSFTGIRLGLAAARGITLAAGLPLYGITSFAAAAAIAAVPAGHTLLVALESRRAEIYFQLFDPGGGELCAPAAALPEALATAIAAVVEARPVAIAGDAATRAAAALAGQRASVAHQPAPSVVGVARVALRRWQEGAPCGADEPLYLRPPDVTAAGGR